MTYITAYGSGRENYADLPQTVVIPSVLTLVNSDNSGTESYTVTAIGESALNCCRTISEVVLPSTIRRIGGYAFASSTVQTVDIPSSVTEIGENAFHSTKLKSATIPASVTTIGGDAFRGISDLETVIIEDSPLPLELQAGRNGYGPFMDAQAATVHIGRNLSMTPHFSNASITTLTFGPDVSEIPCNFQNTQIEGLILPDNVTYIPDYYFGGNVKLKEITLGKNLKELGVRAFEGCTSLVKINFNDRLETLKAAFYNCSALESVSIPASVIYMDEAFSGCSSLKNVTFEDGDLTLTMHHDFGVCPAIDSVYIGRNIDTQGGPPFFQDRGEQCVNKVNFGNNVTIIPKNLLRTTLISTVAIPDGVAEIGEAAFQMCPNLASVSMGSNLTKIDDYAFGDCQTLKDITLPSSLQTIGLAAFSGCKSLEAVSIPGSVEQIGSFAFNACTNLKEVRFEDSDVQLEMTGEYIFRYCPVERLYIGRNLSYSPFTSTDVTSVEFGNKVTIIPKSICSSSKIEEVTIPDNVTEIGSSAFNKCKSLSKVALGKGLKKIGDYAFNESPKFSSLVLPESLDTICKYAFYGCKSIREVSIPASVKSLGEYAFAYIDSLRTAAIPATIKSIPDYAFAGCRNLEAINLPEGIEEIGKSAFQGCGAQSHLEMPSTLLNVKDYAFADLAGDVRKITLGAALKEIGASGFSIKTLTDIVSLATVPPACGNFAFRDNRQGMVHVAAESVQAYKDAGWGAYGTVLPFNRVLLDGFGYELDFDATTSSIYEYYGNKYNFEIPATLEYDGTAYAVAGIKSGAFAGLSGRGEITVTEEEPIGIAEDAFSETAYQQYTLFVPIGSRERYMAASGWKNFNTIKQTGQIYATSLSLTESDITVDATDSIQLIAVITPDNVTETRLEWTSDNESVATVDSTGLVKALGTGRARIKAATTDGTNRTAYCYITVPSYKVSYVIDGEEYRNRSYDYDAVIEAPDAKRKTGYTFSHWDGLPERMPAHDITVYAVYIANRHTVVYLVDGEEYLRQEVDYGVAIQTPEYPEKEGYSFSGWENVPESMPDRDVYVSGHFSINSYKLTVYLDGKVYLERMVEYDSPVVIETPEVAQGFIFDGWEEEIPERMPAHDVEIHGTTSEDNGVDSIEADEIVDVYSLSGLSVRKEIRFDEAIATLPKGIYIIKGQKIAVH